MTATPTVNPKHIERGQVLATPWPNLFLTPDGYVYIKEGQPGWSPFRPAYSDPVERMRASKRGGGDWWTAWVQRVLARIQLRRKRRWR